MLQALVLDAQGEQTAALKPLAQALELAGPEGYVTLFVNEGEPLQRLLKAAVQQAHSSKYALHLLSYFGEADESQPLVDPLSERELEILALIAAGLKNQEIADQLIISLNTVLYHNKNIYGKLGVSKRALAIAKARELNLLPQ